MSEDGAQPRPPAGKKTRRWRVAVVILALLVGGFGLGLWLTSLSKPVVEVPAPVASQAGFPIFVPSRLPGNFEIDPTSFTVSESTLLFSARDGTGGRIFISEQARPADFDFDRFYTEQLLEPQILQDVPFPTVSGEAKDSGIRMASIVTPDTWIIINSAFPLSVDDFKLIAQHIKRRE